MSRSPHRIWIVGFGLIVAVASTSVGVASGSDTDDPGPPEPAVAAYRCGVYERRLLPSGSVLMFESCPDPQSPRCPAG